MRTLLVALLGIVGSSLLPGLPGLAVPTQASDSSVSRTAATSTTTSTTTSTATSRTTSGTTVRVRANADGFVDSATPRRNYGRLAKLSVDGAPSRKLGYLRFDLSRYAGKKVLSAHLRVRTGGWRDSGSPRTQVIRHVPSDRWAETRLTFRNRPQVGTRIGSLARTTPNRTYTRRLSASVIQRQLGQQLSLAIAQPRSARNGVHLASRHVVRAAHRPTLVLRLGKKTAQTPSARGREAAAVHDWGNPVFRDEFNYTGAPKRSLWKVYDSAGHAGKGRRSPAQVTVNGSALQITGLPDGTTGGMSTADVTRGRTYGRWEARMRVNQRDPEYHPVLILWPDGGRKDSNNCMEIDYSESTSDPKVNKFFLHHNCSGGQSTVKRAIDMTQWHNYAVEWTADHVIGFIDGEVWFTERSKDRVPHWPAHQTIQLDWFPDGTATKRSWMQVDWWRMYDVPGTRKSG